MPPRVPHLSPKPPNSQPPKPRPHPQAQSSTGGFVALLSPKRFGRVYSLAGGRELGTFEPNSLNNQ